MNDFKILDCTLREAPIDGLMWGDTTIKKLIGGMEEAGINIIEVGFLKNNDYRFGSSSFKHVEEMLPYLKNKRPDTMYVALVDYGRYDLKYLSDYDGKAIDAIRVCFKKHEIGDVLNYAEQIRQKGYQVCIQHVDTLAFTDQEIIDFVQKVNDFKPFAYSVVDTFGAMYETDMNHLTDVVASVLDDDIWLGFHGHNNLMLADANAQAFINKYWGKRKIIIDSSIYGCGRSAGNAHTELMTQFADKEYSQDYDIDPLLDLMDSIIVPISKKVEWGYSVPYFISAIHNAHTFNVKQLLKRHNIKSKDLRKIIEMLDETQKRAYDYTLLEKLYVEYFNHPVDDTKSVRDLSESLSNHNILLIGPGKTAIQKREDIDSFITEKDPIVIGINNLISDYHLDYVFYSGINRYQNLQYQDYRRSGSPKIILSSNIKTEAEDNEIIVDYLSLIKFGWVNIDSSAILLLRLLIRCGIKEVYIAGFDGYNEESDSFYDNALDTGIDKAEKIEHTKDNLSMLKDIGESNNDFKIQFITPSVYEKVFK